MTMPSPYKIIILFLFIGFQAIWAQKKETGIGTEIINVVKPYTPTISDAFKIKELPTSEDEETTKKEDIKYHIFSFPVASTFVPEKGKASDIERIRKENLYNNLTSFGIGNYGTIDGSLFVTENMNQNEYFSGMLHHLSSQGGIRNIVLNDKYSDTKLDLRYSKEEEAISWNIDLGYRNQANNWYGLPLAFTTFSQEVIDHIDPSQTYNTLYLGGKVKLRDSSFDQANILYKRFWDKKGSLENRFFVKPSFEFDFLSDIIKTDFIIDYVGGRFKKDYMNTKALPYSFVNIGMTPHYKIENDDLVVNLGITLLYSADGQNNKSHFYVYPQANVSYIISYDAIIAYAGIEGGLYQNSYADFVDKNPFVSPTLEIMPTDQQMDLFFGLKGKISSSMSYNVKGSLLKEKNKALFKNNGFDETATSNGFTFGNSFGVVYDDMTTLSIFGALKFDVNTVFSLGLHSTFNSFTTHNQEEAWNLPKITFGANGTIKITDKWIVGTDIFFVGQRQDQMFLKTATTNEVIQATLDSFFDANTHIHYKYNDRFTFFIRANNIANLTYERWLNYPVQQFQCIAGGTYQFDF